MKQQLNLWQGEDVADVDIAVVVAVDVAVVADSCCCWVGEDVAADAAVVTVVAAVAVVDIVAAAVVAVVASGDAGDGGDSQ